MTTLQALRTAHENSYTALVALISHKFEDASIWHWYRALHAIKGENGRRNDDTSFDTAMAADTDIKAAHDEYIRLLHIFYRARDGEHGVLGLYRNPRSALAADVEN